MCYVFKLKRAYHFCDYEDDDNNDGGGYGGPCDGNN